MGKRKNTPRMKLALSVYTPHGVKESISETSRGKIADCLEAYTRHRGEDFKVGFEEELGSTIYAKNDLPLMRLHRAIDYLNARGTLRLELVAAPI